MKKMLYLGIVFLFLLVFSVNATFTQIYSLKDTYTDSATLNKNKNYGSSTTISFNDGSDNFGLIDFNLSLIPINSTITTANIYLYFSTTTQSDVKTIYAISTNWNEGTYNGVANDATSNGTTWYQRWYSTDSSSNWSTPGIGTNDYNLSWNNSVSGFLTGFIPFNVTNIIQAMTSLTISKYGFLLKNQDTTNNVFRTKEYAGTSSDPYINITYTPPQATFNQSPLNNTNTTNRTVYLECNATVLSSSLANITEVDFYIANASGYNYVKVVDGVLFYPTANNPVNTFYTTTSLDDGNYYWWCVPFIAYETNPGVGIQSQESPEFKFTIDNSVPIFSNNKTFPSNYSYNQTSYFNITLSEFSTNSVWLGFQGINYSGGNITHIGTTYIFNITNLGAGSYNYTWYANDTVGNFNSSNYSFSIAKGILGLNVSLTTPIFYGANSTYKANETNIGDADCVYNLYRNGTLISTNSFVNDTSILLVGHYSYVFNTSGCSNYSSATNTSILVVNKAPTTTTILTNPSSPTTYGIPSNFTCNSSIGATTILYINGSVKTSENGLNVTRSAGSYAINCSYAGNENYSASSQLIIYTINKANSLIYLYLNNTRANISLSVGNTTDINASLITGTGNIKLYKNGTLINSGLSPLYNLTNFTIPYYYNITALYEATENYSTSSETWFVNVTDLVFPTIQFIEPTYTNNSNYSRSYILVNITANDNYFIDTITIYLWNQTNLINTSKSTISPFYLNFTNLNPNEKYYINSTVNDSSDNINKTETRLIQLDNTSPTISVIYPTNTTYRDVYSYNLSLNITGSDSITGINNYSYSLNQGSNISFTPNSSIINLLAGNNNVTIFATDYLNNIGIASLTFNLTFTPKINDINISNSTTSYTRQGFDNTGLLLYWRLDQNNTNQIDNSGNSYNGTVINATFTNNGKIGGAYEFDGISSGINTSALPLIRGNNITIATWVYIKNNRTGQSIIVNYYNSTEQFVLGFRETNHKIEGAFFNSTGGSGYFGRFASTNAIEFNRWYHIVIIYNGSLSTNADNTIFYLDNVLQTSSSNFGSAGTKQGFRVGSTTGSANFINGSIDEVMVFNRSLSATEVMNLYYITNPTFQEYPNVTITANITDEDTSQANLWYSWLVDGVEKLSGYAQNIFSWFYTKTNQIVTLNVNDSNNYQVTQTWNVSTTFINPTINFTYPTPSNNSFQSSANFTINITGLEANLNSSWVSVNNINYTLSCIGTEIYICNRTFFNNVDGNYTIIAYVNDSVGNVNNTEQRNFVLDLINPTITFIQPNPTSSTYSYNESILLNFTSNDLYLDSCWYNFDNGANNTITCNTATYFNISEGTHTIYAYANDTVGRLGNASQSFTVSLGSPNISLIFPVYPTNGILWVNYNNLNFTYNATDTPDINICQIWTNISGFWEVNLSHDIASGDTDLFLINFSDGSYLWNIFCNDTTNKISWISNNNLTLDIDTIYPTIQFASSTELNNSNFSRNWISINVSVFDINYNRTNISLYNSSFNIINNTNKNQTNFTGLNDGFYYYNATVYDMANNINKTETRKITLDITPPTLNLMLPSGTYITNESIPVNFSVSDNLIGVSTCWYSIYNSGGFVTNNLTINGYQNFTINVTSGDIDYGIVVYANDSINNLVSVAQAFDVRMLKPEIYLNNTNFSVNNITLKTKIIDNDPIDSCQLWGNWSGWHLNQTKTTGITSNIQFNWTSLNISEGDYLWGVYCNDTYGNSNFSNNKTFRIDITSPTISDLSLSSLSGTSTTIYANCTDISGLAINYPYVAIYHSTNGFKRNQSMSLVSGNKYSYSYSTEETSGTYNFSFYCADAVGNSISNISNSLLFTYSAGSTPPGGGGGGPSSDCTFTSECVIKYGDTYICKSNKCVINPELLSLEGTFCNYDKICDFDRGESWINCKCDPVIGCGNKIEKSGDCFISVETTVSLFKSKILLYLTLVAVALILLFFVYPNLNFRKKYRVKKKARLE